MVKCYYADVAAELTKEFNRQIRRKSDVKIVDHGKLLVSDDGKAYYRYIVEAEEGIIDPKWEIK